MPRPSSSTGSGRPGTVNPDFRSLHLNCKLVLAMREQSVFCELLAQHFLEDLTDSVPIVPGDLARRRWSGRLLERLGGACAAGYDGGKAVSYRLIHRKYRDP